ncbi:hypothetical protein [Deinococcus pimensis]|uniref:hypothetical protein n=1 Tax=Deinococcus pimensis TaxID=309888 RepID=UPI000487834D|nr:hypothetical protein [Deinococcus pimensis]
MSATTWLYGTNARIAEELRQLLEHRGRTEEDARLPTLLQALAEGVAGRDARPEEIVELGRPGARLDDLLLTYHRERLSFLDHSFRARQG